MIGIPTTNNIDRVAVREILFGNNKTVSIPIENRGVVKVCVGYNGYTGYADDTLYINGGIVSVTRHSDSVHLLTYEFSNNLLTITSPWTWSYGFLITTRMFY